MVSDNLKIVILAGGVGTRLWPMSSNAKPKQFQKLVSDKSMLQESYERVSFVGNENIYISTNKKYANLVREQLPQIPIENIILEPYRKGTAAGLGLAAAHISRDFPDAVMASISADHIVKNTGELKKTLEIATDLANEQETLNIIEVKAESPATNYGYVKVADLLDERNGTEIYAIDEFVEKPDFETAKKFLESGKYLWNTGNYVWKVQTFLHAIRDHLPQTFEALMAIKNGGDPEKHFQNCEETTIDYGIMEKVDPNQIRIIPAKLGWSDIGTWESLHKELAPQLQDNITKGKVLAVDTEGCLIYNEGESKINTYGVKDLIIVQTRDHTLICPKYRSKDLKDLLKQLNEGSN